MTNFKCNDLILCRFLCVLRASVVNLCGESAFLGLESAPTNFQVLKHRPMEAFNVHR